MQQDLPLTKQAIEELKKTLSTNKEENIKKINNLIAKIKEAL